MISFPATLKGWNETVHTGWLRLGTLHSYSFRQGSYHSQVSANCSDWELMGLPARFFRLTLRTFSRSQGEPPCFHGFHQCSQSTANSDCCCQRPPLSSF